MQSVNKRTVWQQHGPHHYDFLWTLAIPYGPTQTQLKLVTSIRAQEGLPVPLSAIFRSCAACSVVQYFNLVQQLARLMNWA